MNEAPPSPLAGVRVLDLSRVLAGPWAGQLLADYGADVIKVERPGSGDDTRSWGPPWWGEGIEGIEGIERVAAYFVCANRGKRSLAIDIASAEGAAQVRELAAQADVLLENYKVGQLARYGLDAASLQALNPGLIYCSITGYGQTGPLAHRAGYDFAIQAEGGLMSITGEPGGEPQKVGVAVVDLMTGVYATTAILAALHERQRTGRGRHIDAALFDVQVAMLANQASNQLIGQRTPTRMGNAHPNIVPYQVFPTRDGHVVVAVGNDSQFARLCEAMAQAQASATEGPRSLEDDPRSLSDDPRSLSNDPRSWATDPRFATNPARVANRAELVPRLSACLLQRDTADWAERLEAVGVPCSPILDIAQVMAHPQTLARQMVLPANATQPPMVATPMRLDGQRPVAPGSVPVLGAGPSGWNPKNT